MATKKEQVAFELENPGGFVTQASQIGMDGKPLDKVLDDMFMYIDDDTTATTAICGQAICGYAICGTN